MANAGLLQVTSGMENEKRLLLRHALAFKVLPNQRLRHGLVDAREGRVKSRLDVGGKALLAVALLFGPMSVRPAFAMRPTLFVSRSSSVSSVSIVPIVILSNRPARLCLCF